MKRICTICARANSKGVPGKNWRELAGKPLIAWTIEVAMKSGLFDAVAVSSDSLEIQKVARQAGIKWVVDRPAELATDTISKLPAILHAVETVEVAIGSQCETIVDLDATSPLRVMEDLQGAIALFDDKQPINVITGAKARRSPYFNLVERNDRGIVQLSKPNFHVARRQDAPECFDMNASIYVWKRDPFVKDPKVFYDDTLLYVMPEERSIDIDNELDFFVVESLMNFRSGKK